VDVSSAYNDNDGYQNASNHPNYDAFATLVGVPLTVQVVLSILKPAGSAGATVQLAIVLPELLKVMSVMVEPIIATWSAPRWMFLVPIMIMMDIRMRQITPTTMPLPLFKPTAQ
jgi:hypothetical protein